MKTLFCDLDNTLLFPLADGSYGIKEEDLKALRKALKEDVRLVLATGRPAEIKHSISEMIGCNVDAVGLNGQQIITQDKNIILAAFPVEDYCIISNYMTLHYPELSLGTADFNNVYYANDPTRTQPMKRFRDHHKAGIIKEVCTVPALDAFKQRHIEQVAKFLIYIEPDTDAKAIIQDLNARFDKFEFIRSNKMFIEGLCKGHSKRSGIEAYIKMHNLNKEDCFCAGDADNDIEMFELFQQHSYCMSSGTPNAKKAAAHQMDSLKDLLEILTQH